MSAGQVAEITGHRRGRTAQVGQRQDGHPFALNVEQAWSQADASTFYSYSPVTGSNYLMTVSGTSSDGDLMVTGGNNALVEFNP